MKKLEWTEDETENVQQILSSETWIHISASDHTEFLLSELLFNTTISEIVFHDINEMHFDQIAYLLSKNQNIKSVEFLDFSFLNELFYDMDWDTLNFTDLSLDGCNVESDFDILKECKTLRKLSIKNSFVPIDDLVSVIIESQIESLSLECTVLTVKEIKQIVDAVIECDRLVSLNIAETCESNGVAGLIASVLSTRLQKIKFGPFNTDAKMGGKNPLNEIAKSFDNSSLKSLSIYGLALSTQFFGLTGSGLDFLTKLRLDGCSIGDSTIISVAELVRKKVVELDMSRNNLGNEGLKILVDAIVSNENFHTLDITENPFDEDGFQHISKLLKGSLLRRLILDSNHISRKAMEYLADGMKTNKALYSLYMEGCEYNLEDMQVLLESLYNHKYLFGLYVNMKKRDELDTPEEVSAIAKQLGLLLKHNTNIRQLGCILQGRVEIVQTEAEMLVVIQEPEPEMKYLLSCIQENYSISWIGEPDEYYYDDKKRYSDVNEYKSLVPITNRNQQLQTKRATEFFLCARKYLLLDLPNDLIFYMINRAFKWALIHPRYQKTILKCLTNRRYVGKVHSNAKFSTAILYEKLSLKSAKWFFGAGILLLGTFYGVKYNLKTKRENERKDDQHGKPLVGGPFSLVDHTGNPVTDLDFRGKYMLIYFGYTFCPDICPEELDKMADIVNGLERKKQITEDTVVPIFVSCDPKRTFKQIKTMAKAYRLYFSAPPRAVDDDEADYLVDHSIFFYLMGPNGEYIAHYGRNDTAEQVRDKIIEHVNK
ncbi:Cu-binding protein [Terramyces sp. JEL0728]|nr:Cu-binding protein [Terramyces sp. JEL0728]